MNWWPQWFFAFVLIFVCCILMIVILLQRGRGGGFVGAFGGAGGTSAFGAKTGDVFTWITVVVAGVFVLLTSLGTFVFDPGVETPVLAEPTTMELPLEDLPDSAQPIKIEQVELGTSTPGKPGETTKTIVPITVTPGPPPGSSERKEQPPAGDPSTPVPAKPATPEGSSAPAKEPEPSRREGQDKPSP